MGGFFHLHQPEVCWNWTMEQWNKFCKDCVEVLDATHFKWEPVKAKDGRPVIDKRTGQPKSIKGFEVNPESWTQLKGSNEKGI